MVAFYGSGVEYLISYGLEAFYGTRFWDYSYLNFNLNGRICITYTIFWGILAVLLMKLVKPCIDKIINKFNFTYTSVIDSFIVLFIAIDIFCTVWGIQVYKNRALEGYYGIKDYKKRSVIKDFENEIFSNEKMKKTFPNLRILNENGEEIWIRDII